MNIGELAKFRAGIEIPASGTAVTTYLKAADTQGLALVNSSGTSVVTVSDAGAVTVGPAVASSTSQHIVYGAQDTLASFNAPAFKILSNSGATNDMCLAFGLDKVGTTSWIGSYQVGVGGAGLRFGTLNVDVGGYSSAGAWTLGPSSGTTEQAHTMNTYITGDVALTINQRKSTNCALKLVGNNASYVVVSNSNGQGYFEGIYGKTASSGGAVYITSGHLLGTSTSIREAKTNIHPLGSTLGWLKELKPCVYQYRKQIDGVYTDEPEDFVNTGLIYDEVVQVNPQLCFDTEDGKPSGVEYTRLITPMLKALQELNTLVTSQQALIEALQAKVAALEAR